MLSASTVPTDTSMALVPEYLKNVPFPPKHLDLEQILNTKPHRSKLASYRNAHIRKRTINAFLLYRKECNEYLKKDKNVNPRQKLLSPLIAKFWKKQPEAIKIYYEDLAIRAKKLHKEMSPQIQIRHFDPKSMNNGKSIKNKNHYMQTDEFITSPTSSNDDDSVTFVEMQKPVTQLATIHDSSFQEQLCGFYHSSLTYNQNLYIYHLCKLSLNGFNA
ncbi:16336_t:CDS:1 [Funneliformis geosporum]|uniref:11225_t:CDS:1 n=1 Tax=Funneliformis geosporum TaxID=1117311 RepID=A0A9W4SJB4_9GLOM|nr:11225_t:CDS:1 [Funneliformis geosporum]CAI2172998.1 16336_t:CDS:1 [Funneliformis geosporum]